MTKEQLISYLENVTALELAINTQEKAMEQIDQKACCLKQAANIKKPVEVEATTIGWKPAIVEALIRMYQELDASIFFSTLISGAAVLGIVGWVANGAYKLPWESYFHFYLNVWLITEAIYLLYCIVYNRKQKRMAGNTNQEAEMVYCEAIEAEKRRLTNEERIFNELGTAYFKIKDNVGELRYLLNKLYGANIIYPDFQGLVPVSYLYKYIASGIAEQLEGPTGAYAQYLNDERANKICKKLDDLSMQLSKIIQLQKTQISILGNINQTLINIEKAVNLTNDSIQQMNSSIRNLTQRQVEANEYLNKISHQLTAIASSVDTASVNTQVLALNDYRKAIQEGVNEYYLRFPA